MPAHYWVILGLILMIGEVFTTDFSLSCIGIACLVSALCSWIGLNIYWQIAIGAVTIFVLFFTLRPFMLKYMYRKGEKFKSNMDALGGEELIIADADLKAKKFYVRKDGDIWEVVCDSELAKGDKVKVLRSEGIKLIVKKESK